MEFLAFSASPTPAGAPPQPSPVATGEGGTRVSGRVGAGRKVTDMRGGRPMTERVRALRRDTTDAERVLWRGLRHEQLGWRFRRQHPIPPYVVDFACPEARLVVEADGGQHAVDGEHVLRDEELHRKGWRVLRLWNNDILENPTGVLQTIVSALGPPP